MGSIYEDYAKLADQARLENLKRSEQVSAIFDEIIQRYGPGGSFGAGYEAQLGRQKVQDVGTATQGDISRGLSGLRDRGAEWEATTGSESRLRLEDLRMERLSSAQQSKAGFLERIETPYPDYSSLMQLSQGGGTQRIDSRTLLKRKGIGGAGGDTQSLSDWLRSNFTSPSLANTGGGGGVSPGGSTATGGQPSLTDADVQKTAAAQGVRGSMVIGQGGASVAPNATTTTSAGTEQSYMDWPSFLAKYHPEQAGKVYQSAELSKQHQAEYTKMFGK